MSTGRRLGRGSRRAAVWPWRWWSAKCPMLMSSSAPAAACASGRHSNCRWVGVRPWGAQAAAAELDRHCQPVPLCSILTAVGLGRSTHYSEWTGTAQHLTFPLTRMLHTQGEDTAQHLEAMSSTLLALSCAYCHIHWLVELPDALLMPLLRGSSRLHSTAAALGVRLTLVPCQSAHLTQVSDARVLQSTKLSHLHSTTTNCPAHVNAARMRQAFWYWHCLVRLHVSHQPITP